MVTAFLIMCLRNSAHKKWHGTTRTDIGLRQPTVDRSPRTIKCRTTHRPICQYYSRGFVGDDRVYQYVKLRSSILHSKDRTNPDKNK